MTGWTALDKELAAWAAAGLTATLWWRDDDAVTVTPALDRLFEAAGETELALAVIPALADEALARRVDGAARITVLQHGYRHANNAAATAKKCEFPAGRDPAVGLDELRRGRVRLAALFGSRVQPLLVPPWNRIDPALAERLPEIGIGGLSVFGRRGDSTGRPDIPMVNTHVDIIDWHGGRRFLGTGPCLAAMIGHLKDRRAMRTDPGEATGLLTHHLVHDAEAWAFIAALLQRTSGHPAVRWLGAGELLAAAGA